MIFHQRGELNKKTPTPIDGIGIFITEYIPLIPFLKKVLRIKN